MLIIFFYRKFIKDGCDESVSEVQDKKNIVELISPKFIFQSKNQRDSSILSISKDSFRFLNDINRKIIRKQKEISNLKHYPVGVSSVHFDQCISKIAHKSSALYPHNSSIYSHIYWSSFPSTKEKSEYVILKVHPCLSFITGICLHFLNYFSTLFNCAFIQVSFGFHETEFYFSSGKIPIDITDIEIEISFNTAFLANYLKIEFFDKFSKQYSHDETNYYVCLENLGIKGLSLKQFSEDHKKLLYPKFVEMQPSPQVKMETYIENLIFLDKENFKETEQYKNKMKVFEECLALSPNRRFNELFYFYYSNHKFLKNFGEMERVKDILSDFDRDDIHRWIEEHMKQTNSFRFVCYPIFKCFR